VRLVPLEHPLSARRPAIVAIAVIAATAIPHEALRFTRIRGQLAAIPPSASRA